LCDAERFCEASRSPLATGSRFPEGFFSGRVAVCGCRGITRFHLAAVLFRKRKRFLEDAKEGT
jgi:hypothetical protein